jgi:hypothetical protein
MRAVNKIGASEARAGSSREIDEQGKQILVGCVDLSHMNCAARNDESARWCRSVI